MKRRKPRYFRQRRPYRNRVGRFAWRRWRIAPSEIDFASAQTYRDFGAHVVWGLDFPYLVDVRAHAP